MQRHVYEHARYLVKDEDSGRWKSLPYSEMCEGQGPNWRPMSGLVEVLGQLADVIATKKTDNPNISEIVKFKIVIKPVAIARTNASTMYKV